MRMIKKKSVALLAVLLSLLCLISTVGCGMDLGMFSGCAKDKPVERIPLTPEDGVPDWVINRFLDNYLEQHAGAYTDRSYQAKHSVYLQKETDGDWIIDFLDLDIVITQSSERYRVQSNDIFVKEPGSDSWGWNSMSFTRPEKIEGEIDPWSGDDHGSSDDGSGTIVDDSSLTDDDTWTTDDDSWTTGDDSSMPSTFMFGGAELQSGTAAIDPDTVGINGVKVVGTRKSIKHITREEVEALVKLCPNIRKLDLDYCYLDDYTPLAKLTGLTSLSLMTCGNAEGGGRKLVDIDWIASLTNLRQLNLCHNDIDDIRAIAGLEQLEYLNLADNDLDDRQLEYLSGLYNLRELDLYQLPKLTDVSPLAKLTNLEYLHLGQDRSIKTVKPLTGLKYLKKLRLNGTNVTDISYFKEFKALQYVDLSDCSRKASQYYALENCQCLIAVTISDASDDVKSVFGDMGPIELWLKWGDPSSRVVSEDLWSVIDRSGICRYLDMTYNEIKAKAGTLQTVGNRFGERDYMLHPFCFEKMPDYTFAFNADLRAAYHDGYDLYENNYPGYIIEPYLDGDEPCIEVLVWDLSELGYNGKFRASDIGAEIGLASNEEGDWCAHAYYGPYCFTFHCDEYGWIDGNSWCTVQYSY